MINNLQRERRTFAKSYLSCFLILLTALTFSYASSIVIIVHQPQAMAETLNSSSSSSTAIATKIASNNITQTSFHKSYEILINDSRLLTQTYQNEVGKWQLKQYNNSTMASITDSYLPKFQKLVDRAGKAL